MREIPLSLLSSPFVLGILLPERDRDALLARFVRRLEGERERGMFRTVPLADERAYRVAAESARAEHGLELLDGAGAVLENAAGKRVVLRLVERLTN